MRILLITGLTSYGVGGARAEAVRLLRGIVEAGHTAGFCADRLPDLAPPGVQHFQTAYPFQRIVHQQLARAVEQFRPDVVHAVGGGIRFLRAAETVLRNTPWALTIHNVPPAERIVPALFDHPRLQRALRAFITAPSVLAWHAFLKRSSASAVICHSRPVEEEIRHAGRGPRAIEVIPLGCDLWNTKESPGSSKENVFRPDAHPKILSIGGLAPHKGQLELIHAIKPLLNSYPNVQCVIIGSNRSRRYRDHLVKSIARFDLAKHVQLQGVASEATKMSALRQADVYVQPSREEGFCLAFLEGAASVPKIVGTKTGAIPAVAKDHPAAEIVPPGNINELTVKISQAVNRPAPSDAELQNSRSRLQADFSWDVHRSRHLALYERLHVGRKGHSSSDGTR